MAKYSVVITTCESKKDANKLAKLLIKNKLAACVQVYPITSFYEWKGKSMEESEYTMLIKTQSKLYSQLEKFISKNVKYEISEIIQIPIDNGLPKYLKWIDQAISKKGN